MRRNIRVRSVIKRRVRIVYYTSVGVVREYCVFFGNYFQKVCSNCSPYKSPIPYLGIMKKCRICRNCILCYSNCLPIFTKNYLPQTSSPITNYSSYATFAESKCCGDVYVRNKYIFFKQNHCLHPSERMNDFGRNYKSVGDFQITALWVPDSMSLFCSSCKMDFSFFKRRHHCRMCGRVFCKKCSSSKIVHLLPFIHPRIYHSMAICQINVVLSVYVTIVYHLSKQDSVSRLNFPSTPLPPSVRSQNLRQSTTSLL